MLIQTKWRGCDLSCTLWTFNFHKPPHISCWMQDSSESIRPSALSSLSFRSIRCMVNGLHLYATQSALQYCNIQLFRHTVTHWWWRQATANLSGAVRVRCLARHLTLTALFIQPRHTQMPHTHSLASPTIPSYRASLHACECVCVARPRRAKELQSELNTSEATKSVRMLHLILIFK